MRAQDSVAKLPPVITVTRDVGRSALDLPFAITETRPDSARPGQTHLLLDQTLFLLPGVTVANRNNPSQDPRISIRGFGARSAFGVRSIKVLRDGMPLTLPDGQTPIDYLDLESVGRVETIRGTASALYGNAASRMSEVIPSDGTFAYGGYPDMDELYKKQATETDKKKREAMLHQLQRMIHDRVRLAPIYQYIWPSGIGPRVEEPALMLINPYPWSAPLEEVRLKKR